MKLYATVTSERASKGQGGNEYVNINCTYKDGGETKTLSRLNLVIEGNEVKLYADNHGVIASSTLKGKQQKGEGIKGTK